MLIIFVRTLLLYTIVIIVMRVMGKRQIGQLQPFELVVSIMIAELAAIPMQNPGIPLINGIIPILTLLVGQIILSYINLKSEKARGIICGKPSILIKNGKIIKEELNKQVYTIHDLMEQLRIKNFGNIADIEFAILETNGEISIIPKSQKRPIVPKDLNIATNYEGMSTMLLSDGKILKENLKLINQTEVWLKDELKKLGVNDISKLFIVSIDTEGNIFYQ